MPYQLGRTCQSTCVLFKYRRNCSLFKQLYLG